MRVLLPPKIVMEVKGLPEEHLSGTVAIHEVRLPFLIVPIMGFDL